MFEGLRNFVNLMDIPVGWSILIFAGLVALCFVPYKPVYKITEKKDEKGNTVHTVYKYREK